MPVWRDPTELEEHNELNDLWVQLEKDVRDDPSFEEIVGIDDVTMLAHATASVKAHFAKLNAENNIMAMLDPKNWIQIYTMGFVVGARFGRTHPLDE
jgi:hypothetical protein